MNHEYKSLHYGPLCNDILEYCCYTIIDYSIIVTFILRHSEKVEPSVVKLKRIECTFTLEKSSYLNDNLKKIIDLIDLTLIVVGMQSIYACDIAIKFRIRI